MFKNLNTKEIGIVQLGLLNARFQYIHTAYMKGRFHVLGIVLFTRELLVSKKQKGLVMLRISSDICYCDMRHPECKNSMEKVLK